MNKEKSICDKIIEFDKYLSSISIPLPESFKLLNPFNESSKLKTEQIVQKFYNKFYNDNKM